MCFLSIILGKSTVYSIFDFWRFINSFTLLTEYRQQKITKIDDDAYSLVTAAADADAAAADLRLSP